MDVTALGELLIDFTRNAVSAQGNPLFEANPGGAPCNVLAMLQKLGRKTALISKVGKDMFGDLLCERAEREGIDLSGLARDEEIPTTLAFVQTFENGDRDFSFYRKPGADLMLNEADVRKAEEKIKSAKIFHFGTLSMTGEPANEASLTAIGTAKEAGCLLSFDPNYRAPLWRYEEEAKEKILYGIEQCDILKISDNEIEFITGETDIEKGIGRILEKRQIPLVFATLGPDGSMAFYGGKVYKKKGFSNPATIETTGAGDTFMACALNGVLEHGGLDGLTEEEIDRTLSFANAAASIITTRRGALSVMPEREEVEAFLKREGAY
ncbi:MAG: carbohydrate kinase [Lachnospiraceae bacterium]|nr:carbohydrate kinase [Lachnospiraceae bacterium]